MWGGWQGGAVVAVVAAVLVPRELSENTLTVCCCVVAFERVKISIVSVVPL